MFMKSIGENPKAGLVMVTVLPYILYLIQLICQVKYNLNIGQYFEMCPVKINLHNCYRTVLAEIITLI